MPAKPLQPQATREDLNKLFYLLFTFTDFRRRFLASATPDEMRAHAAGEGILLSDDQIKIVFDAERRDAIEKFAQLRRAFNKTAKVVAIIPSVVTYSPTIARRP